MSARAPRTPGTSAPPVAGVPGQTPAVSTGAAAGSRPASAPDRHGAGAGPARTWTLELPPGTTIISGNNRLDRWTKNRLIRDLHAKTADAVKRQMGRPVPQIGRVDVEVEYVSPPRLKRMRHPFASDCISDSDNIAPTGKACADGLVKEAHLWPSDSKKYIRKVTYILAPETHPRGLIRIHITEVGAG